MRLSADSQGFCPISDIGFSYCGMACRPRMQGCKAVPSSCGALTFAANQLTMYDSNKESRSLGSYPPLPRIRRPLLW